MRVKVSEFQKTLENTLTKTINEGLGGGDKKALKDLKLEEEELLELENEYRLIGELFGRKYIINLLDALLELPSKEKEN
jgi:hypothetical protein